MGWLQGVRRVASASHAGFRRAVAHSSRAGNRPPASTSEGTTTMSQPTHLSPADIREPYKIAPDTWVIPELVPGPPGLLIPLNSMVIAAEEHAQLLWLMSQLTNDQRELLELRLAGLSAAEIGRVLGRSPEAVRKAQSRTVYSLRMAISARPDAGTGQRNG